LRACVVSLKDCWQDSEGNWLSTGGFPGQMGAIASLFDETTSLIGESLRRDGGLPLPRYIQFVPLRQPAGEDGRRKLSVLAHLPYYVSTFARYIRQADVVYVSPPGDMPFLGMLIALTLRKRLLTCYCGSWFRDSTTTLMNRATRSLMRRFAGGRNVMLAPAGDFPLAKGISPIFFTALTRSELDQICPVFERGLADPPRLSFAGRLTREKGVRYLVEALGLLKKERFTPLPLLTVVGDGPERGALENKAKELRCGDLITFAGQLDRTELSSQFSQADLYVHPSLSEGYCQAWLDAMAHGLPVLTSDVGAARAVIGNKGERGWLVPAGDAQELAASLRHVISDHFDWPSLRRTCRAYVEGLTLETWAQRIGQICAEQWGMSLVGGKLRV